ncbi:MAG: hypothetical protein IKW27_01115 [Bacteroidales bacterium]|nr:hypothetical protein [Bacteroidales bacterium]
MTRRQATISASLSATLILLTFAFFNFLYPYHIHYQEQLQFFRFGADYFLESVSVPGGLGDWMTGFLVQFFYYAPAGALILSLLLGLIQFLTWKNMEKGSYASYPLSFLPAVSMFLFFGGEENLITAAVALAASLAAAFGLMKIRKSGLRNTITVALIPVLYMMFGGISFIAPVIVGINSLIRKEVTKGTAVFAAAALLMAAAIVFIARLCTPYPLDRLIFGVHYHRFSYIFPLFAWISVVLVPVAMLSAAVIRKEKAFAISLALAVLPAVCFLPSSTDMDKEKLFGYDFMTRMGQWNKILATSDRHPMDSPIAVECVNLALAKTGHLSSDMFAFYQNGTAGLLPKYVRDHFTPGPTGTVYYHLGMINTAQTFFFEAQEGIPDFQKSARFSQALAKTNLLNGNYAVARKYVSALKQTIFYRKWAKETEKLLDNPALIEAVPEYAHLRSVRIRSKDFLFSQDEMDSMLGLLYLDNRTNTMAMDYLLTWCLLRKDLPRFLECHQLMQIGYDARHYQEAVILYWSLTHDNTEGMPGFISRQVESRFTKFISDFRSGKDEAIMQKEYGDTYWFYYCYRLNTITEENDEKNNSHSS